MCGIFGVISEQSASKVILKGLSRLEYRGYDSAGVAIQNGESIKTRRASGKLAGLIDLLETDPVEGLVGIGHTRWATHGEPNRINAHPHKCGKVAVVHNGIIENHQIIREELIANGHKFVSATDSEVIPHLINQYLLQDYAPIDAIRTTLSRLTGSYALGILIAGETEQLFAAKQGSPLTLGEGADGLYIASDALALGGYSQDVLYPKDSDIALINQSGIQIFNGKGKKVYRKIQKVENTEQEISKQGYPHFMLKEIYEQPAVVARTIKSKQFSQPLKIDFNTTQRLSIVACGTSYYAGSVAKYWFERYAKLPVELDIASEFRYRYSPMNKDDAALFISQSGETADTLAALEYAKAQGSKILSLVNVDTSTIARESDVVLKTCAGPEIGVASTKAFTTQLTVLANIVIQAGVQRGTLDSREATELRNTLLLLPEKIQQVLNGDFLIQEMSELFKSSTSALFLGRGSHYPIALEGALKMKEITYIHAEGYAAGELKHGPIALVEPDIPIVIIAPDDELTDKLASNVKEVVARGGRVVVIGGKKSVNTLFDDAYAALTLPDVDPFISPIVSVIPMQLLAYHVAVIKGTDVDRPRNLAKSVTVE